MIKKIKIGEYYRHRLGHGVLIILDSRRDKVKYEWVDGRWKGRGGWVIKDWIRAYFYA